MAKCEFRFRDKQCITDAIWVVSHDTEEEYIVYSCAYHLGNLIRDHYDRCTKVVVVAHIEVEHICPICGGEGEHDWEVHSMEMKSSAYDP